MDKGVQVGGFFAEILPFLMGINLNQPDTDSHKREAAQGGCRQRRIFDKHNDHYRNNRNKIRYQSRHEIIQHVLQGIDIPNYPGKYFSRGTAVKKL